MGQDRLSLFVGNQEMPFAGAGGHSGMIVGLYFPFGKLIFEIVNTEVMKKSGPGSCLGIPSELSGNEPGDIRNVQTVHEAGCLKMLLIPLKLFEFGIGPECSAPDRRYSALISSATVISIGCHILSGGNEYGFSVV